MKEMNEQQMDMLITETLNRQHVLEEINKAVMCDVRRAARRNKYRYWRRIVAFSFGLPLVLLVFGVLMARYVIGATDGICELICPTLPIVTVIYAAWKTISDFSIEEDVINRDLAGLINEV